MLIGVFSQYFFGVAIFITSVFLVMLVLVQRGRGGGLVGALGGPGGQSALGTKAGDIFTRITIVVAAIWIFLCAAAVRVLNPSDSSPLTGLDEVADVRSGQVDTPPGSIGTTPATTLPRGEAPGASDKAAPGESTPASSTPRPTTPPASSATPSGTSAPTTPPPPTPAPGTAAAESSTPATPAAADAAPENSLRSSKPAETAPPADGPAPAPADKEEAKEGSEADKSEPPAEDAPKSDSK